MARTDPRPHYGQHRPRTTTQGYVAAYDPLHPLAMADGYVLEHRRVAWDAEIITDRSQHVHHLNHDKQDNRPENLSATTNAEHARAHVAERGTITNQFGTHPLGGSTCSVRGCDDRAHSRGWCQTHYRRWKTTGDVRADVPIARKLSV
jgi:hypothetical protein